MDLNGPGPTPTRFRPRKSLSTTNRFLGAYSHAPLHPSTSSSTDQELNEDDIVFTPDFSSSTTSSSSSSPPTTTTTILRHHHNNNNNNNNNIKTTFPENPGILAALPETSAPHSHFYNKTVLPSTSSTSSSSSSTASASRLIPTIPKPPQDRIPISASLGKHHNHHLHHQSAPVNVPILAKATIRKHHREFDEIDLDEDEDGDGEMLPPHEIVARSHTPVVACSVLEGVGRTLKGRDLRQVRNAVWRQTGFLD